MKIQQTAECSISINRFDTKECINIDFEEIVDIDEETANYLLSMKSFSDEGLLLTNFVKV